VKAGDAKQKSSGVSVEKKFNLGTGEGVRTGYEFGGGHDGIVEDDR